LGRVLSAPLDVRFSSTDVLQPDLLFFTKGRLERLDMDRCATAAPDLVVEIVSPGTRRRDRGRKRAIYEREGVGEYWIVDPEAKDVTVLRRAAVGEKFAPPVVLSAAARDTLGSPLFPGLRVPLSRVFRGV
jgi:Uma2 family endonuclease